MFRKQIIPLSSLIALAASLSTYAVDESRLWLPSNYERQYLKLVSAAKAAESLDRCVKMIRGTIDLERSSSEHPIFRIQCRQENGRTYNEMVDGLSFETLTTPVVVEKQLSPDEIEALRLEEERKKLEALENAKLDFLSRCKTELASQSKLFIGKELLEDKPEPQEFSLESAKYYLDFNAEDINGVSLKYRAICWVGESVKLKIRTRRE